MPAFYADYLVDLNRYYRSGKGAGTSPDVQRVLGRAPTSFERFVQDHAGAFAT